MADYNDIKARIQEVIRPNGTGAITAADHQKLLLEMVDKIDNDFDKVEENIKNAASQDGKYPELTAGFANNLVGRGEAVDATINFRPSGGMSIEDGAARVKELKGNSVVWNQRASIVPSIDVSGLNYSVKNDNTLVIKGTLAENLPSDAIKITFGIPFQRDGRKYFIDVVGRGVNGFGIYGYDINNKNGYIWSGNEGSLWNNSIAILLRNGESIDAEANVLVVDLTQMFGAGNEPTTIEEFYNRIPQNVDLYAYNEGEVIHTNADGIKSVGFNAWDEEWEEGSINPSYGNDYDISNYFRSKNYISVIGGQTYFFKIPTYTYVYFWDANHEFLGIDNRIMVNESGYHAIPLSARYMRFTTNESQYNGDICINLAHSGYRNGEYQPYVQFIRDIDPRIREAFPNGMRSAGNAHDKVYNKNGKGYIEKHIGVLDLGALGWVYDDSNKQFYSEIFAFLENVDMWNTNVLCSKYATENKIYDDANYPHCRGFHTQRIYMVDPSFTDAATFQAAMSGVMLYYERAEPEILEFDEPFNLDYEVWDFGTEQMLSTEPSAPIKASIVYGFNAVDSVRTAQLEIAELKTQIAQMQAIMASMTAQSAALTE